MEAGANEEVQPVEAVESLVREGDLADLPGLDQGQHAVCAVMDHLLVELAQQGRSDAPVAPLRVERQGQQVCIAAGHTGDRRADQLARRQSHRSGLLLVERLDNVAAAVGGGHRRPGQIDQADDLLNGGKGVAMIKREDTPAGRHRVVPAPLVLERSPFTAPKSRSAPAVRPAPTPSLSARLPAPPPAGRAQARRGRRRRERSRSWARASGGRRPVPAGNGRPAGWPAA